MTRLSPACVAVALASATCGGSVPPTRYYQLYIGAMEPTAAGDVVMVVEPFLVDSAYDDDRIVYRRSPYKLDYYHYHRWSAPPGELISAALRDAYRRTGQFQAVTNELTSDATVVLSGRVLAIEEVDMTREHGRARIAVELRLRDAATDEQIWSRVMREEVPLRDQSPAGLARALSVAVWNIARRTSVQILAALERDRRRRRDGHRPS